MHYHGLLQTLPKGIKLFIGAFVFVLSVGFYTGLLFVNNTGATVPAGIEENYLGNEDDEEARVMKFKKSEHEMFTIVHTHILSMSFIFLLLGILVWLTKLPYSVKLFATVEPFVSVLLTFGGIYLVWSGMLWMKYVVAFSGVLMTATFVFSSLWVLWELIKKPSL